MKWDGDEKRIQALFSELSFEDRSRTTRFEKLWQRAELARPAQSSRSRTSTVVFAAVAVIVAAFLFGLWSHNTSTQSPTRQDAVNVTPQTIPSPVAPVEQKSDHANLIHIRSHPYRQKRLIRRPAIKRLDTAETALLSKWQSPTAAFLESPSGPVFNSLPQLNQAVEDLKSFLPKNNQVLKESNK